jgi:tRNA(fMet)-specific endonuclease VapC
VSFLPDTNVFIKFLNPGKTLVKEKFLSIPSQNISLCSLVIYELYFGAYKSERKESNLALLDKLSQRFRTLPFDNKSAKICGNIRADLSKKGTPIGPNDLIIAAIAIQNNLVLVTHNTKEFSRVKNLKLEDWEI